MIFPQLDECIQYRLFFSRHGTRRNPDSTPAGEQACERGIQRPARGNFVILQISEHRHFLRIRSNRLDSQAVHFRLHPNNRVILKDAPQPSTRETVSSEGLVRNSSIDHHDSNPARPAGMQKVRPNLGLRDNDHFRIHAFHSASHAPWKIDWEIKCVIDDVVPLAGKLLSGRRRCRYHQRFPGKLLS